MPFVLNDKIRALTPYDPIEGVFPIRLDANESPLPVREAELNAMLEAVKRVNPRRYPDHKAEALCAAAADYYNTDPALLTAWNGLDEAILLLSTAFLGKGNTLLCYALDFSMYHFYSYLSGAACMKLPKREDFSIDVDATLKALWEHRPAMFLFSNPCNPTSLVLTREDVRRIIRAADEAGTLVALDEAYMTFSDQSLIGEVLQYPNLVILRTMSKAAGLAGLRLGFTIANPEITRAMHSVKPPYNVGALTQAVGQAALCQPERLRQDAAYIRASCDALSHGLRALGFDVAGDAANFCFVANAAQCFEPLKAKGIVVRKFGAHLRITAGLPEENAALLETLKECRERG
jgi:histidinol-phosphate aminotransferase